MKVMIQTNKVSKCDQYPEFVEVALQEYAKTIDKEIMEMFARVKKKVSKK